MSSDNPPGKEFYNYNDIDTVSLFSQVLLIEDDSAHAHLIRRALKGTVGEVRHVSSGGEALDVLEQELAELVFCDLHLPDTTGIELIGQIQKLRPGLPIIMLTSSSRLDDAVKTMREGAWDYMVKQFTQDLHNQITLTVRRTAERKLQQMREIEVRKERDAFWVAAWAAEDGMAILGSDGVVVFSNEAFRNFCILMGDGTHNIVDLIARTDFTVAGDLCRELRTDAESSLWSSELRLPLCDDEDERNRYFQLKLNNVATPRGPEEKTARVPGIPELRYHVLWVRDITQRKEQERFQRDLLATTTHDLKGPLGAILTSAELLNEHCLEPQSKGADFATRISSCARSSISIIDELLSARRIQDGVMVVRPRWHNAADLLEDIMLDYLPVAKAKSIEFKVLPTEGSLEVFADKIGFDRVLGNLVSNALKFTGKQGRVEIGAQRVGAEVQIFVSDNGPGIDAAMRHKLFNRFERLERHSEIDGSGLGLFVSKNIMEAHNGRIAVTSRVGEGTTFTVTFPDGASEQ